MKITKIISVSPVNPAHGLHEVLARTNEELDVDFQISPDALGCLTGYFNTFPDSDAAYAKHLQKQARNASEPHRKKGS